MKIFINSINAFSLNLQTKYFLGNFIFLIIPYDSNRIPIIKLDMIHIL